MSLLQKSFPSLLKLLDVEITPLARNLFFSNKRFQLFIKEAAWGNRTASIINAERRQPACRWAQPTLTSCERKRRYLSRLIVKITTRKNSEPRHGALITLTRLRIDSIEKIGEKLNLNGGSAAPDCKHKKNKQHNLAMQKIQKKGAWEVVKFSTRGYHRLTPLSHPVSVVDKGIVVILWKQARRRCSTNGHNGF